MFPIPPELNLPIGIAIAVLMGSVAVWNFFRGLRSAPPAVIPPELKGIGLALGSVDGLRDVAEAIREGHEGRGELILVIRALTQSVERLTREIEDAARRRG